MKIRPILFNTDMVRAILAGRKTATRRLTKTQKPPATVGDILYIRETWSEIKNTNGSHRKYVYKATDTYPFGEKYIVKFRWHPSIHMPKAAARIWLKVTDVRVERLQDMKLDDFLSEGAEVRPEAFNDPENAYGQAKDAFIRIWESTIKGKDQSIYMWGENPWVWVIEFERCEKPESCILEGRKLGIAIGKFCLGYSVKGKDGELSDMCKKCKKCISAKE